MRGTDPALCFQSYSWTSTLHMFSRTSKEGRQAVTPPPAHPHVQVAEQTLRVMRRVVPAAIPGIMFLSGGQVGRAGWLHACFPG